MWQSQHITLCCVSGCNNSSTSKPGISFYSIPTDARFRQWLTLIGREDFASSDEAEVRINYRKVCEDHFSHDAFVLTNSRKKLKKTALPTKYLPSNMIPTLPTTTKTVTSKITQTDHEDFGVLEKSLPNVANELCIKLKTKCEPVKNTFYQLCNLFLSNELQMLMKAQDIIKLKQAMADPKYYDFCFDLYTAGPQTYKILQKTYGLRSVDLLLRNCVKTGTKLSETVLKTLKTKVDKLSVKDRNCSLLIKPVKLKANLCYNIKQDKIHGLQDINGLQYPEISVLALTIMIQGIFLNWKQPLGYILLSKSKKNDDIIMDWLDSVFKDLFQIGLNIRTLVSSIKDDLINEIIYKKGSPFFPFDTKKIYPIFDAADLINSIRDSMILYNFHFQNKVAKFQDIVKFYETDKKRSLPYAHELTASHFSPGSNERKDVKYAAQLLNRTVASGLSNYTKLGLIKNIGMGTVKFLNEINNLSDTLGIPNQSQENDNERTKSICKDGTHIDTFKDTVQLFESLTVINRKNGRDVTSTAKFIPGVLITLQSISSLLDDLKAERYNEFHTRNLRREVLDDLVQKLPTVIKKRPKKLTTLQFQTAFRILFLSSLKKFTQAGKRKGDVTNFLEQIQKVEEEMANVGDAVNAMVSTSQGYMSTLVKILPRTTHISSDDAEKIQKLDFKIGSCEKYSLIYISALILKNVKKVHSNCSVFRLYLYSHVYEPDLDSGKFQRYNCYKQNCTMTLPEAPCDNFIKFVEKMDEKFIKALRPTCWTNNTSGIADAIFKDIETTFYKTPCQCFPKTYAIKLFIRIRIFHTVYANNKEFKRDKKGPQIFCVPELYV